MNTKTKNAADILWNHHRLDHEVPQEVDLTIGLGHTNLAVAQRAIEVSQSGLSGQILFCGRTGLYTRHLPETEAKHFADYAVNQGVPPEKILMETESRNTGENISNSAKFIREVGARTIAIVTVTYHELRTMATVEAQLPCADALDITVTSPRINGQPLEFNDYSEMYVIDPEILLTIVANASQKMIDYPKEGFITPQPMSDEIREALEYVQSRGYSTPLPPRSALDALPLSA